MLLFFFIVGQALAQNDTSNQHMQYPTNTQKNYTGVEKEVDTKFLVDAIQSNSEEITMTQLAENKSSDLNVKSVATNIKTDHQRLLEELKQIVNRKSITLPPPDSVKMHDDMKELLDSKPADFNMKWVDIMIKSHQETLEELQKSESTISDNDIRGWIKNTIPKVENHIAQLTALKKKVK